MLGNSKGVTAGHAVAAPQFDVERHGALPEAFQEKASITRRR